MRSRILVAVTVLACLLVAAPLWAQTLEGQIVEDFQGTVTYTFDLNGPPAGSGLLLGLNLDRPAKGVVTALRERGVLSGGCVGLPDQLRLLPPLVLSDDEADLFLAALGEVLA